MIGIRQELAEAVAEVLESDLALDAKLHWRVVTKPVGWDDSDETSQQGGSVVAHELEFRALFHRVDLRLSGFQRFQEISTGDVILDYAADLALDSKEDCRIEVAGGFYVQKNASKELLEAWDAYADHGGSFKTILLTEAK